jgi:hypothetical protein
MLAPRFSNQANGDRRSGRAAIALTILVMLAAFAVLAGRNPVADAPGGDYTNISPTAQVVWEG